jgi:hypothetical protein
MRTNHLDMLHFPLAGLLRLPLAIQRRETSVHCLHHENECQMLEEGSMIDNHSMSHRLLSSDLFANAYIAVVGERH